MNAEKMSTAELIEAAKIEWDRWTEPSPATFALHARGTRDVLEAAATMCRAAEPKSRAVGAHILGQLGQPKRTFPEECCEVLLEPLNRDDDDEVTAAAVFALGHLRNDRAIPKLVELRCHPNAKVRHAVASALYGVTTDAAVAAQLVLFAPPFPRAA
jgi:HEAT repeat protein